MGSHSPSGAFPAPFAPRRFIAGGRFGIALGDQGRELFLHQIKLALEQFDLLRRRDERFAARRAIGYEIARIFGRVDQRRVRRSADNHRARSEARRGGKGRVNAVICRWASYKSTTKNTYYHQQTRY